MKENVIFHKIRPMFESCGFYGVRVENLIGVGTPDCFFSKEVFVFIELKQKNYKTLVKKISPSWRPGQIAWAQRHIQHGGNWMLLLALNDIFCFSEIPKERYAPDELQYFNIEAIKKLELKYKDKINGK